MSATPEAENVEAIEALMERAEIMLRQQVAVRTTYMAQTAKVSAQIEQTRHMLKGLKDRHRRALRMNARAAQS